MESEDADVAAQEERRVSPHLEGVPVEEHKVPPPLNPADESQDWGSWSGKKTHTETLEEEMIAGLQQVPWRKVVSIYRLLCLESCLFAFCLLRTAHM